MINYSEYSCRCDDVKLRKEYVQIVDSVRESGGDVRIFSSMHISGERKENIFLLQNLFNNCFVELEQLTGIAAILRFPMPELEEDSEEEEEPN